MEHTDNHFRISPMMPYHVVPMAELERQCFSCPWSEDALRHELDNHIATYFVMEYGNPLDGYEVAGYIGSHTVLDEMHITNVAVAPGFRRRGIASALLEAVIGEAKSIAISFITLEVRVSNRNAISLYAKYGFTIEGMRKAYYEKPVEDGYIMTLVL